MIVNKIAVRVLAAGLVTVSLIGLFMASGCHSGKSEPPKVMLSPGSSSSVIAVTKYAGSEACASCHKSEFDSQSHSNHAFTMRAANRNSLGNLSPPLGPIAGTPYSIKEEKGEFTIVSTGHDIASAKLQYALGSGVANITFVGSIGKSSLVEFRMSYNPGHKKWYITPGQETNDNLELGAIHERGVARKCLLCHASAIDSVTNYPIDKHIGVGCESCHGPGSSHVDAMRKNPKDTNLQILQPTKSTPHEINNACGVCHRSIKDIPLKGLDAVNTVRFQPYAIEISPCFRKSGGALSCISCHNPHNNSSTDLHQYEQVCLSCHNPTAAAKNKLCPVNAKDKCIGCHMPQRRVLPGTKIPLTLTDHLIWAVRGKSAH